MNRRTFLAACFTPFLLIGPALKPSVPLPLPKWRATIELRINGKVMEIRSTDCRTEAEAEAVRRTMAFHGFQVPSYFRDYEVSSTITKL